MNKTGKVALHKRKVNKKRLQEKAKALQSGKK